MFNDQFNPYPENQHFDDNGFREYPPQQPSRRMRLGLLRSRPFRITAAILLLLAVGALVWAFRPAAYYRPTQIRLPTAPVPVWNLSEALSTAMSTARTRAQERSEHLCGRLIKEIRQRAQNDFLPRHLSYGRQQQLACMALYQKIAHAVSDAAPTAEERIQAVIEADFNACVLRPDILDQELTRITADVIGVFVSAAASEMEETPRRMTVPEANWAEYSAAMARITGAVEANRQYPLMMKAVTVSGGVLAIKAIGPLRTAIVGSAGKAGTAFVTRLGGRFLGVLATGLLVTWDVYDHKGVAARSRQLIEKNLDDYCAELQKQIAAEVMCAVADYESQVLRVVGETDEDSNKEKK